MSAEEKTFEGWAILELMGHRRLAGYLSEAQLASSSFIRIDVFQGVDDLPSATQFYSAGAVYAITPTTEATARAMRQEVAPIGVWDLRRPLLPSPTTEEQVDQHMDELEIEAEAIEHEYEHDNADDPDLQF